MKNKNVLAHVLAILTVGMWGSAFVSSKYVIQSGLQVYEIFFLRFCIAYLCIWLWILLMATVRRRKPQLAARNWRDELLFVCLGLTGGTMYFLCENLALSMSYVNNVSFIICTAPLITVILGRIFTRGVKITRSLVIGSAVAIVGIAVVIFNGHFVLKLSPLGDVVALTAATSWAVYSLLLKNISEKGYDALFMTRKVFAYGILTVSPIVFYRGFSVSQETLSQPVVYGNLLFLGMISSFVGFLVWNWVINKIGALKTSNYVYLNPVSTVIASALALDEPMTVLAYIGSGLILGGVFLANSRISEGRAV